EDQGVDRGRIALARGGDGQGMGGVGQAGGGEEDSADLLGRGVRVDVGLRHIVEGDVGDAGGGGTEADPAHGGTAEGEGGGAGAGEGGHAGAEVCGGAAPGLGGVVVAPVRGVGDGGMDLLEAGAHVEGVDDDARAGRRGVAGAGDLNGQ